MSGPPPPVNPMGMLRNLIQANDDRNRIQATFDTGLANLPAIEAYIQRLEQDLAASQQRNNSQEQRINAEVQRADAAELRATTAETANVALTTELRDTKASRGGITLKLIDAEEKLHSARGKAFMQKLQSKASKRKIESLEQHLAMTKALHNKYVNKYIDEHQQNKQREAANTATQQQLVAATGIQTAYPDEQKKNKKPKKEDLATNNGDNTNSFMIQRRVEPSGLEEERFESEEEDVAEITVEEVGPSERELEECRRLEEDLKVAGYNSEKRDKILQKEFRFYNPYKTPDKKSY